MQNTILPDPTHTTQAQENITDSINLPPLSEIDVMIIAFITRQNTIEWVDDPNFGTQFTQEIEGVGLKRLSPETYYTDEQITEMVNKLNKERVEYLARYP